MEPCEMLSIRSAWAAAATVIAMAFGIAGCTTASEVYGAGGEKEWQIACGASTSFSVCFNRAAEVCPSGYFLTDQRGGFNRKEIRVRCKDITP